MTENLFLCGLLSMFVHALFMGCTIFTGHIHLLQHEGLHTLECGDNFFQISALVPGAPPPSPSLTLASAGFFLSYFSHSLSQLLCRVFTLSWVCSCSSATSLPGGLSRVLWWVRWRGLALAVTNRGSGLFPKGATPAMPQLMKPCYISLMLCDSLSAITDRFTLHVTL